MRVRHHSLLNVLAYLTLIEVCNENLKIHSIS